MDSPIHAKKEKIWSGYQLETQDLIVWQKAHQFVLSVYRLTRSFPREELYGLTSQFRRAAISVAANIAEGFKKRGKVDIGPFHEHR